MNTSLLVPTSAVSCYSALMLMKNVYQVSTEQHGEMKLGILRSKNATILQARCASALFCLNM